MGPTLARDLQEEGVIEEEVAAAAAAVGVQETIRHHLIQRAM